MAVLDPSDVEDQNEAGEIMAASSSLIFFVNGKKVVDSNPDPSMTLLTYLRNKLRLCGTKLGCGEGGCGACTVMVSKYNRTDEKVHHMSVNACLAPVVSMHGLAVTTVEGIGNAKGRLHAVQQRLADSHGSQCGFCTPGIVMSMYTLLRNNPLPTMKEMETYFQGNLCRCTGYRPILEGFRTFTEEWTKFGKGREMEGCGRKGGCCKENGSQASCGMPLEEISGSDSANLEFIPYSSSQEPLFPPELILNQELDKQALVFRKKGMAWYRPTTLKHLLSLKDEYPQAKIVVGNTELGVEVKFKHCNYPVYINPTLVQELNMIEVEEEGVTVGSAVTLTDIEDTCAQLAATMPRHKVNIFNEIKEMLQWFAGKQIRNVAAVGGNIMTGSPISDLNPIFMAANCKLKIQSLNSMYEVQFDHNFYTGYRQNILAPSEVLVSITIPFTRENQFFYAYKQARRRDDDIAIVNSAFNMSINSDGGAHVISGVRMAFGGMGPTTIMALQTMQLLEGKLMNDELVELACNSLQQELNLSPNAPGAMVRYRQSLVLSFFFKTFLKIKKEIGAVCPKEESAIEPFEKEPLQSHQIYEIKETSDAVGALGKPIKHKAADHQVAGTALYTDDIPPISGELYAGLVLSTKAHAKIVAINTEKALLLDGVHGWIDSSDLGTKNKFGTAIVQDELVFAEEYVYCVGMVIGVIVASDQATAQTAARLVQVQYEELPAVITIDDAIATNSFHPMPNPSIVNGDVDSVFQSAPHIVEGEMRTGAQEQFYLETNACIAIPKIENDEIEVWSSTQNPTLTQNVVASVLGVSANRVVVRVKRMGGGFGGKESRSVPLAAAIAAAANKMNRPVRIMLDRDEDMLLTGFRNPFLGKYKVAFDDNGQVLAADVSLFANAGWTLDLTFSVVERAMFHSDNSYKVPHLRVQGFCCKTNLQSNTAFRGFGGPQGLMIAENWVEKIAEKLGVPPETIRERNLYREGDTTHFNQQLSNCTIQRCWQECKAAARFDEQKTRIAEYNMSSRWKKRGISMIPVKFGIAFTAVHLNQSGALVNVYHQDGSVLISHGGTEMGQGLHTKMIQVASQALEIADGKIHIAETSTDKVPNTPPTAASAGSDLNGMAVLDACLTLKKRLEPFKQANPTGCWEDWVRAAFFSRVSLSTTGYHATPDIGYSFKTNSGNPFNYFTYGVACSVVEVDCLTGDHQVISTDIVMDLGESINPAIDIGQVEGAFVQGYGLFMLEQVLHSPSGVLLTRGPGAYKIPSFNDIPGVFNVSLLRGAPNPRAVFSSKAVGEPPLFLAASVFFATKNAVSYARAEAGVSPWFHMDAPATAERIRMSCEDRFTGLVPQLPPQHTFTPWALQV